MTKKNVSVLITDLDNTLYDWFEVWHSSFKAMLDEVVKKSGISEDILIPEIKKIHEAHGTAEYLMLLNELPCLKEKHPNDNILNIYKDAIEIYKTKREETLKLYPTVLTTLNEIKKKGCLIVGYTDSQTLYTAFRVKELGLDGVFDFLYSAPNHDVAEKEHSETNHFFPSENHILKYTIHRQTPKDASKPNPKVLIGIIEDTGVSAHEVIYLGDSLLNDISMAQAVPVTDIHAKYGEFDKTSEKYELLRKVSHWKAEKVNHEKDIAERKKEVQKKEIIPTMELAESFTELLSLFEFVQYTDNGSKTKLRETKEKEEAIERETAEKQADIAREAAEKQADIAREAAEKQADITRETKEKDVVLAVDIWKKTIDVQQHFNDLELRIRNYAFTVLGVIISASALAFKDHDTAYLSWVLVLVGLFLWLMFFMMDYHWYHRLLKGSVKHGKKIEDDWVHQNAALGLTNSISNESPVSFRTSFSNQKVKCEKCVGDQNVNNFKFFGKRCTVCQRWIIDSNERMKIFYGGIAFLLSLLAIGYFIAWYFSGQKTIEKPTPSVTIINNSQSPINTSVLNTNSNIATNANTNANSSNAVGNSNIEAKENVNKPSNTASH